MTHVYKFIASSDFDLRALLLFSPSVTTSPPFPREHYFDNYQMLCLTRWMNYHPIIFKRGRTRMYRYYDLKWKFFASLHIFIREKENNLYIYRIFYFLMTWHSCHLSTQELTVRLVEAFMLENQLIPLKNKDTSLVFLMQRLRAQTLFYTF